MILTPGTTLTACPKLKQHERKAEKSLEYNRAVVDSLH
jgi:hypothetical protein